MQLARVEGTEAVVPLEMATDASSDAERYRIVSLTPLTVAPVPRGAVGDYYPDHRADCPGHGNGL